MEGGKGGSGDTHTETSEGERSLTSASINTIILCFNVKQGEGWERERKRDQERRERSLDMTAGNEIV